MAITLKFVGALRHASGAENLSVECGKTALLMDVIEEAAKAAPDLRQNLLDEHLMETKPNALILVNGREISVLKGLKTRVKDGDEVVFVPVVHGG
ncbi:MAG: MoaD/ThiS family protein [Candidatus Bathyarchaeia archaeon]